MPPQVLAEIAKLRLSRRMYSRLDEVLERYYAELAYWNGELGVEFCGTRSDLRFVAEVPTWVWRHAELRDDTSSHSGLVGLTSSDRETTSPPTSTQYTVGGT